MDFKELIFSLSKINEELRENSLRAVNTSLTFRNWFFGFYILEFEQNGQNRAEYGKSLLANISIELKSLAIPNTDERELRRYRQFYMSYPSATNLISENIQIRGLLPPELLSNENEGIKPQFRKVERYELQKEIFNE